MTTPTGHQWMPNHEARESQRIRHNLRATADARNESFDRGEEIILGPAAMAAIEAEAQRLQYLERFDG